MIRINDNAKNTGRFSDTAVTVCIEENVADFIGSKLYALRLRNKSIVLAKRSVFSASLQAQIELISYNNNNHHHHHHHHRHQQQHGVLAPVVQTMDSAIRRINHYPLDSSIGFASVYPLDSVIYLVDSTIHHLNKWGLEDIVDIRRNGARRGIFQGDFLSL